MNCHACPAPTRVLETRQRGEFNIVRRHECENGHRFTTVQMLYTVTHGQRTWLTTAQERALRGVARRRKEFAVRAQIAEAIKHRHKEETVAAEVGCSARLVRKVKALVREGKPL